MTEPRTYSQRERIMMYIQSTFGTGPEYLWADSPDTAVFRHPASRKWFAILMDVAPSRLGLSGEGVVWVMNVKSSPLMIGSLLSEKGFLPAYHMNKDHWVSILLDDTVSDKQILPLLELSYDSVAPKRRRRAASDDQ